MTLLLDNSTPARPPDRASPRRKTLILAIIAVAQLMVILDASIVNVALPDAQADLGISDANRQWVVTAYALAFGGLLLLGGRIADFFGRRRTFVLGAVGFAGASAVGGVASSELMLFAARGLQGAFAALLAPAALSLLTTNFPSGPERARAFAVYGAVSGGGAAVGLLLGGVLTEYLNWRWTLLVNIPIAAAAALAAVRFVPESRASGSTRYDVPGAVTATAGLAALVYGFTEAESGWGSTTTLGFIAAGVGLLIGFVLIERRSTYPLLPLRIPLDRTRGGAYLTAIAVGGALGGAFLFLVYYLQSVLGYSAIESGLASLPIAVGVIVTAAVGGRLIAAAGPRLAMTAGALMGAGALFALSQLGSDSSFLTHVLPAEALLGVGVATVMIPLTNVATLGVRGDDAGAASALTNASQQVGMSLGVALVNTFYATAVADSLAANGPGPAARRDALVEGYTTAFGWGALFMLAAAAIALLVITARKADVPTAADVPTPEPVAVANPGAA